ncbi:prepilin peptidase [Pseudokineococcus basanitobsidens]|uniref:Prepilin leader peptidase/N-methyltransferase n=1 Tax=Pseudokineococcus basanitobsidens TaxID=1926649 RepID=A0ABU8RHW2_9ACTN
MTAALVLACAVLGLLVGSFLNVVVHRVPAGESVVSPPSACPRCGHRLRVRDNVPVLSWLVLRGRCRDCRAPISARYPLLEAGTAALLALTALELGPVPALPAFLYLACVAVALTAIDLEHHRLPDRIVLPSYVVGAVLLVGAAALQQDWWSLGRAAVGLAALWLLYFGLAVAKPGGMGFGDVKLAGLLGMHLGYLGWAPLVVGAFAAFLVGGLVGVALLATRRAGRTSAIPFGPFMLLGAALGVVVGPELAQGYLHLVGLG